MNKVTKWIRSESLHVPIFSIILGLLVGAIIMLIGNYNPVVAYSSMFKRVFGELFDVGETIRQITPLIFTGLAVAFAFRTGLFNIGAEGQFVMGSLGAVFIGVQIQSIPWYFHIPLAILAGALLGGLWGMLVGYLKAKRGVHEVITSIMLNWTALYLSNYVIQHYLLEPHKQRSKFIADSAWLSNDWLKDLFVGARIHYGFLLALLAALLFYYILWKTKQGYELRAVGHNSDAAEYAGMNVKKNIILAMFISGIFAGLGGVGQVLGVFKYQVVSTAFPGYGFMGIAVALIGRNTAIGVLLGAVLLGMFTYGAPGIKTGAGVPEELVEIIIALIIFFVASSGLVKFLLNLAKRKGKVVI